jgi:hypothetical protein
MLTIQRNPRFILKSYPLGLSLIVIILYLSIKDGNYIMLLLLWWSTFVSCNKERKVTFIWREGILLSLSVLSRRPSFLGLHGNRFKCDQLRIRREFIPDLIYLTWFIIYTFLSVDIWKSIFYTNLYNPDLNIT